MTGDRATTYAAEEGDKAGHDMAILGMRLPDDAEAARLIPPMLERVEWKLRFDVGGDPTGAMFVDAMTTAYLDAMATAYEERIAR